MNYTKLFYWLTVADNARTFFGTFVIIFTAIAVISTIVMIVTSGIDSDNENAEVCKASKKWMWWSFPPMIFFWALLIFTPTKRDALLIVAGGQTMNFLSTDSTARKIPHELSDFVVSELKNMAKDAKVELNINTQKERILDEAKKMTGDQLIEKMKSDPDFKNIILNKKEE